MAYNVSETYITKNGARENPTHITDEAPTTESSTTTFGGVELAYLELVERPSSAEGYKPTVTGYTESDSLTLGTDEFYIDYRTARLYFHSTKTSTTMTVDYYGYGTVIRNEHINTLQTDLNKVQYRAMTALNGIMWELDSDGTGSVDYDATGATIDIPQGTLYLPPAFDNAISSQAHGSLSGTNFDDGDVVYCPLGAGSQTLAIDTYTNYCALTDAAVLLAMRQNDICYLIGGHVLIDGESYTPSGGSAAGTATVSSHTNSGGDTTWVITHALASTAVLCQVYDTSGNQVTPDEITITDSSTVTITLTSFGSVLNWVAVIVG